MLTWLGPKVDNDANTLNRYGIERQNKIFYFITNARMCVTRIVSRQSKQFLTVKIWQPSAFILSIPLFVNTCIIGASEPARNRKEAM